MWLIWSLEHEAWWKPNRNGYTENVEEAGTYTFEEAKEICAEANKYCVNVPKEALVEIIS